MSRRPPAQFLASFCGSVEQQCWLCCSSSVTGTGIKNVSRCHEEESLVDVGTALSASEEALANSELVVMTR